MNKGILYGVGVGPGDPELLTIISTELTPDELIEIDEAVAGRICEDSKVCTIGRDRKRNYRLKGVTAV